MVQKDCGCYIKTSDDTEKIRGVFFCSDEHAIFVDEIKEILIRKEFILF